MNDELSPEDELRLNVLFNTELKAVRIDESTMTLWALTPQGEASVPLKPTERADRYLKRVREQLSGHALGSPGGYPVHLTRWTRQSQAGLSPQHLAQLLLIAEEEAVVAVVHADHRERPADADARSRLPGQHGAHAGGVPDRAPGLPARGRCRHSRYRGGDALFRRAHRRRAAGDLETRQQPQFVLRRVPRTAARRAPKPARRAGRPSERAAACGQSLQRDAGQGTVGAGADFPRDHRAHSRTPGNPGSGEPRAECARQLVRAAASAGRSDEAGESRGPAAGGAAVHLRLCE